MHIHGVFNLLTLGRGLDAIGVMDTDAAFSGSSVFTISSFSPTALGRGGIQPQTRTSPLAQGPPFDTVLEKHQAQSDTCS